MKHKLPKLFFASTFLIMFITTIWAIMNSDITTVLPYFKAEPWTMATLIDVYLMFIIFYAFIFYKEKSIISKIIWLIIMLGTGSMGASLYMLIQLFKIKDKPLSEVFKR